MNIKSVKLRDIAKVIRSKNAGPFELTFDVIFKTKEDYEKVKASRCSQQKAYSQFI